MKFVLTYTDSHLRSVATQRPPYKVSKTDYLSREIENELVKLIKLELELIQEIYAKVESLKYIFGFEIRNSFEFIDKFKLNYLDENNLAEFLTNNYKYISISDAKMLLKRFDIDNDSKIRFNDYLFIMQLGKNNRLNNYTKLNRLNYSLPDFDNKINSKRDLSIINDKLNYDYTSDINDSSIKQRVDKKRIFPNPDNNYNDYGNLSYKQGDDPNIDTLRFNTSGLNINSGKTSSRLEKLNFSEDKNILRTSLISYNEGK